MTDIITTLSSAFSRAIERALGEDGRGVDPLVRASSGCRRGLLSTPPTLMRLAYSCAGDGALNDVPCRSLALSHGRGCQTMPPR